ncbi:MAG TPA: hypothetical protein VGF22_03195 [Acidimicrobiales bacterium]
MRAEELRDELDAAAARVPDGRTSIAGMVEARRRRTSVAMWLGALAVVTAVGGALVFGPRGAEPLPAASVPVPVPTSEQAGTAGRLVIPGVRAPIAVVGIGELAVHDPQTGDRAITPVTRLNGATAATSAVAVGPWVVVATGGGPGSRAFAIDSHDPSGPPRSLGPAVTAVASATPGLVWLADADGRAREVTLGGLTAADSVQLPGSLVGVTDYGLLLQTPAGAVVFDPSSALVRWSQPGGTALAARERSVAWCRDPCGQVEVSEIGGVTRDLAPSPGSTGSYGAPAAFSPDGRWLAVTRGRIVVVHDLTASMPPSVLSGGGSGARTFTWTGDWLVFSGGSALEIARAPSFSALRYVDAGTPVRAVVALDAGTDQGGPTVVAGGPFVGDGWFVRAGVHTIDTVTDVCFGVFGPPYSECMPTEGDGVEARLIGSGPTLTVVGIVRDRRIAQVRVIRSETTDPVQLEMADVVRVPGSYRVFGWRVATPDGVAHVDGLAADGQFIAGTDVPLG